MRLTERLAAWRWQRRYKRAVKRFVASDRYAQIKACGHRNLRSNPDATAVGDKWAAYVCLDCGTGVLREGRQP